MAQPYGGDHHRLLLVDHLRELVEQELDAEIDQRYPAYVSWS